MYLFPRIYWFTKAYGSYIRMQSLLLILSYACAIAWTKEWLQLQSSARSSTVHMTFTNASSGSHNKQALRCNAHPHSMILPFCPILNLQLYLSLYFCLGILDNVALIHNSFSFPTCVTTHHMKLLPKKYVFRSFKYVFNAYFI